MLRQKMVPNMFFRIRDLAYLGPNYTIRICRMRQAHEDRQAYDMTYDCRSVLKHVLKCYDIFSDVNNNRKSCRRPVVSLSHATKSYRVNRPLEAVIRDLRGM